MQEIYGYVRVSTREQNEDRQMLALGDIYGAGGFEFLSDGNGIGDENLSIFSLTTASPSIIVSI